MSEVTEIITISFWLLIIKEVSAEPGFYSSIEILFPNIDTISVLSSLVSEGFISAASAEKIVDKLMAKIAIIDFKFLIIKVLN